MRRQMRQSMGIYLENIPVKARQQEEEQDE